MFLVAAERSETAGGTLRTRLLAGILQIENCELKTANWGSSHGSVPGVYYREVRVPLLGLVRESAMNPNWFELASGGWFCRIALEMVPPQQEDLSTHRQFSILNLQFSIFNLQSLWLRLKAALGAFRVSAVSGRSGKSERYGKWPLVARIRLSASTDASLAQGGPSALSCLKIRALFVDAPPRRRRRG